jgi:hypothetical protein
MRLLTTLLVVTAASPALSSIWGSDPQPTPWTQEQLEKSQKYLHGVKEDSFNSWNEGRLRQFLLDNGIIEPKGTKVSPSFPGLRNLLIYLILGTTRSNGKKAILGIYFRSYFSFASRFHCYVWERV